MPGWPGHFFASDNLPSIPEGDHPMRWFKRLAWWLVSLLLIVSDECWIGGYAWYSPGLAARYCRGTLRLPGCATAW